LLLWSIERCKETPSVGSYSCRPNSSCTCDMPLDALTLAELIHCQAASLRLWIARRCTAPEDVVQEAFCRLAAADPPPDQPVAWLYRVCRNLAERQRTSDERRTRREVARAPAEATHLDPAAAIEQAEMVAAVDGLPAELREVVIARVWGQLSLEEVGRLCQISTATACRRYAAALDRLRKQLDPAEKSTADRPRGRTRDV
jgi:RNA polymerase sigma factor (sigma-70 family)